MNQRKAISKNVDKNQEFYVVIAGSIRWVKTHMNEFKELVIGNGDCKEAKTRFDDQDDQTLERYNKSKKVVEHRKKSFWINRSPDFHSALHLRSLTKTW